MKPLKRLSVIEQSAEYLRNSLTQGTWTGKLPGVVRLAEELGVSKLTMRAALRLLEDEGLVRLAENGYSRYAVPHAKNTKKNIRVGIMLAEPLSEQVAQFQKLLTDILQQLDHAGFESFIYHEDLQSLKNDVTRVNTVVTRSPVSIYIVVAGFFDILKWFSTQPQPCIALFGRGGSLPIARVGMQKAVATIEAVNYLIKLGHKRIVKLTRKDRRIPHLAASELRFLATLEENNIETSTYNLPDWEESPQGLNLLLEGLFKMTPPTAIITDEVPIWVAVQQFLARKRLLVPEDVSLIASDDDPSLYWCQPVPSHFSWESEPILRHVVRWAKGVRQGKIDQRQKFYPAEFVVGGTIGPVKRSSITKRNS
ncbi:MAG: substrate-binding domain-containing protein [Akkermansiaceae bacterium]